jgi:hypothetical protein
MPAWLTYFLSPIISAGVAFAILYINYKRDQRKGSEGDEKTWRQARLDAEKALRDAIASERSERTQWQLKNEGDLAKIADILEESTDAQILLASIAARMDGHDGHFIRHENELSHLRDRLDKMHDLITNLAFSRRDKPA